MFNTNKKNIIYESLTPLYSKEVREKNIDCIRILKDNKNYNVAVTGGYSSGKSTLLNSIFRRNKVINVPIIGNIIKFFDNKLNISFSTFEKETDIKNVEENIIKKIYYATQFKYFVLKVFEHLIVSGILFTFIFLLKDIFQVSKLLESGLMKVLLFMAVFILVTFINKISNVKVSFGNIEAELCKKNVNENNVFNKNINLIFNRIKLGGLFNGYKYIIFEDLDRFEKPKIFEQLRDLNDTLNLRLLKKVKFIYAIKDDMFKDENRTKFFDFIYPLIPYVSYSNSGEKMLELLKKQNINDNELGENFILDICLYVSDMRILKNTLNEYLTYKKNLGISLEYEKLFSILLYKNTCSEDFAQLQDNDGILYSVIKQKDKYIEDREKGLKDEMKLEQEKLDIISHMCLSEEDCKRLIITKIITNQRQGYDIMLNANNTWVIRDLKITMDINDFKNKYLMDTTAYFYSSYERNNINLIQFLNDNCLNEYNIIKQYAKYKENLNEENKNKEIVDKIQNIKDKLNSLNNMPLSKLLNENKLELSKLESMKYQDLIRFLLFNGYIDENYNIYINKTYTGSLTKTDIDFKMSILSKKRLDFAIQLDNPDKIINKLSVQNFRESEILNISLFHELISIKKNNSIDKYNEFDLKFNAFINTLKRSNQYIEFIYNCLCVNKQFQNKLECIDIINEYDTTFLESLKNNEFRKDIISVITHYLLTIHIDASLIKTIIKYISEDNIGFDLNIYDKEEIQNIIASKNIKYIDISTIENSNTVLDFVIKNSNYEINIKNINKILTINGVSKKLIDKSNYNEVCKIAYLKEYVLSNIEKYLTAVYFNLSTNQENMPETLIELLNNKDVNYHYLLKIIQKENNKIQKLSDIRNSELFDDILQNNFVDCNTDNINLYFESIYKETAEDDEISEEMKGKQEGKIVNIVNFINIDENFKELENKLFELRKELLEVLYLQNAIQTSKYEILIKNTILNLDNSDFNNINEDKLLLLINNDKISRNSNTFEKIKLCSENVITRFISKYNQYIQDNIGKNINFTFDEIKEYFNYNISENLKLKMLSNILPDDIESIDESFANIVIQFVSDNINRFSNNISVTIDIDVVSILLELSNLSSNIKYNVLYFGLNELDKNNLPYLLDNVGGAFVNILKDKTSPKFENNFVIKSILDKVKSLGYNINFKKKNNIIQLTNTKR